jgi:AcrR family transcriptional regulator
MKIAAPAIADGRPIARRSVMNESKKDRRKTDLLDAAAELFRKVGYESTRMEDVAKAADVSPKTVYNYFANKQRLLIEFLQRDRTALIPAYEEVVENPSPTLAETLARLIHADIGNVITSADKTLWREVLAAELRSHKSGSDGFAANRSVFLRFVRRAILKFHKVEDLAVPTSVAVEMVYALSSYNFREYCANDKLTPNDMLKLANVHMHHLVEDWTKRRQTARRESWERTRKSP